jgi:hypothetical protein
MSVESRKQALHRLVASDRVEGTLVCRPDGTQLGTIERMMINKLSGQVAYAVLRVGGPYGRDEKRFPLRWQDLSYDRRRGAFLVELGDLELKQGLAPSNGFDWGERNDVTHIRPYRPPSYWGSSH